jgi:hypothetical protein
VNTIKKEKNIAITVKYLVAKIRMALFGMKKHGIK